MSALNDIDALITAIPSFIGYAATGQQLPYAAVRPLDNTGLTPALNGEEFVRDASFVIYCAAGSVEASYNAALMVVGNLSAGRVAGTTLTASIGYVGAAVEGHYESAVTVQLNTGGI